MNKQNPNALQVQRRVRKLLSPNDKLTQKLFQRPADKYSKMILSGTPASIDEGFTFKKEKIATQYWVELVDGFADVTPPDGFDRAVLDVCLSAQNSSFDGITVNEIARLLAGGKSNSEMTRVCVEQKSRILQSVKKLMCTRITVDFAKLAETGKYPNLPKSGRLTSTILPCKIVEGLTVNGQQGIDFVVFLDESALLTLARAKNKQVLSFPIEMLDVPKQNNTELVTKVKFYVTRRVQSVKAHRELHPTIVLETLYKNCGLGDADNDKKRKARKIAHDVFENLKNQGVILGFEFEKVGGVYRAIKFCY